MRQCNFVFNDLKVKTKYISYLIVKWAPVFFSILVENPAHCDGVLKMEIESKDKSFSELGRLIGLQ